MTVLHRSSVAPGVDGRGPVARAAWVLAALAVVASAAGLLVGGGEGRHEVTTARGEVVTLFGEGVYAADTWLVGAGNRGGDLAVLAVEVPVLLLAVHGYRRGGPVAAVALALTAAWLPGMASTALGGDVAAAVGPYTSAATEALDLGVVVPVAKSVTFLALTVVAGALLARGVVEPRRGSGSGAVE